MPITLATPVTPAAGTRVGIFTPAYEDEINGVYVVELQLRTASGTNQVISSTRVNVRNGRSDRIVRGSPVAGEPQAAFLKLERDVLATPTGYDQLVAAVDAQTTKAAKRTAAEGVLVSLGVIDPTTLGA